MQQRQLETQSSDDLAGEVAVVTGAARNICRAIVISLAAGGARVVVCANTSTAEAEETVRLIEASNGEAELVFADVGEPDDVERLMNQTHARFGRLDILVNNAAVRVETPLLEMSYEEWRSVFKVNLDGVFLCTRAALPFLMASGSGAIQNIGGLTAHAVSAERAHVVASKAAVVAFTKAVAVELADQNITANCVVPGMIDTVRGLPGAPARPASRRKPPVDRMESVWEVGSMVRTLAGPAGRYITGQTIHVSGGGYMP